MKFTISVAIVLFGLSSFAMDRDLKITSFISNGEGTTSAELCGHITGPIQFQDRIEVIADPKVPELSGIYNTIPSTSGNFCVTIRTTTGSVKVIHKIFRPGNSKALSQVTAEIEKK